MPLLSDVRAGNKFISRHIAGFGELYRGFTYTDILFIRRAKSLGGC